MKLRQYLRRAMAAALCLMLCAGLAQPALAASGKIPGFTSSRKCSLTLTYGQAMEGVTVRLYRVASVDADVRFQAEGKFREYLEGVNLNRLTQSGWVELAKRLEGEVTRGQDKAAQTLQAGKNGTVSFQNLRPGLYLVFTDPFVKAKLDDQGKQVYDKDGRQVYQLYKTLPYLVSLPTWYGSSGGSGSSGGWVWDIDAKVEKKVSVEEKTKIDIQVVKTWSDSEKKHDPIQIQLWKDGVPYGDPVVLPQVDEAGVGRWEYYWKDLEVGPKWSITEAAVNGYTTKITEMVGSNGTYQFLIHNQKTPPHITPPTETPNPPRPSGPPPTPPLEEIEIDDPGTPLGPPPPDQDPPDGPEELELDDPDIPLGDLPQTGQLWWPVPVLAIAGMVLFLIGWAVRRRDEYDGE